MKYYKVVNRKGHRGVKYKNGIVTDPLPFNPSGNCEKGGLYFARKDILSFLHYGDHIYEVEPIGEVYQNPGFPKKYKAHSLKLKYVGNWKKDINVIDRLFEDGADIHACNDEALRSSAENGYLEVVQYLIEKGADIHAANDCALRWSAEDGRLKVVKYLI